MPLEWGKCLFCLIIKMAKTIHTCADVLAAIEKMGATHGAKWTQTNLADELGVSSRTITRYQTRWVQVAETLSESRERRHDWAESRLFALIDELNPAAVIFYAKTQLRGRGYIERQELTGADGGVLRVEYINDWRGASDQ